MNWKDKPKYIGVKTLMELNLVIILVVQQWVVVFYNVEHKTCKVGNIILYATFHLYV